MDAAGVAAVVTSVASLAGAVGGLAGVRRKVKADLEECRDNLGDAWSVIGLLLALAPGGELYSRDHDPETVSLFEHARQRHAERVARLLK